jgi:aminoglycoside phosphotransferase (APT) family kinase protein
MTMPDEVVTAFPSLRPPWPAQLVPSGIGSPRWGEWDHETGGVTVADPADDARLPGLRDWVGAGELVAYRPGWRAVLRVPAPPAGDAGDAGDAGEAGEVRWVQVVRVPRTADVVDRHLAVAALVRQLRGPLRVPEVTDVDAGAGVVVLSAVTGSPLRELLAGPVAEEALVAVARAVAGLATPDAAAALGRGRDGAPPRASVARRPADWAAIAGAAVGDPDIAAELDAMVPLLLNDPGAGLGTVVIHGDLDDRNIFLHAPPAGGAVHLPNETVPQVGVVDLDGAGLGEPGRDIASLACHVVLRAMIDDGSAARGVNLASLLLDAAAVAGGAVPVEVIRSWQARTYFRLACIHLFRRDTRHLWRELLERARACADPAGSGV